MERVSLEFYDMRLSEMHMIAGLDACDGGIGGYNSGCQWEQAKGSGEGC